MTQEFDSLSKQMTLAGFQFQVCRPKPLQNKFQSFQLFLPGFPKNDNVIEINQTYIKIQTRQRDVHESLECGWSIAKPKWPHFPAKGSSSCDEGCFISICS